MKPQLLSIALLACAFDCNARDIHVDPALGDERATGLAEKAAEGNGPVKTIARGLFLAKPGDTIHLAPVVFKEAAVFYKRFGEPGKPITLDGHGATLDGGEPIDPAAWTEISPGLFRNDQMLPRLDDGLVGRWFFLWDGKMNHMGRTSKGTSAPLKKPEDLQAGEWTFVKDESRKLPNSLQIFGAFYLKLPPGQKLANARIVMPVRSAGVQFGGDNRHLVIRNLTATHVYNDGFNIHGHCEDVLFENIRAIECGDDGISAHETAQYRVEGFVSIGNSTGICDTGASVTSYNRVFIKDCLGHDLYFLDNGRYTVTNAVVLSSAGRPLAIVGRENLDRPCSVRLENVLIHRTGPPQEVRIAKYTEVDVRRTTFQNVNFQATGGKITLEDCVIRGVPTPELHLWKDVTWLGRNNFYDLRSLRFDQTFFTPQTFADFQKLTGQENGSAWRTPSAESPFPPKAGADLAALEASAVPAGAGPLPR
jgi:hypothetical protein